MARGVSCWVCSLINIVVTAIVVSVAVAVIVGAVVLGAILAIDQSAVDGNIWVWAAGVGVLVSVGALLNNYCIAVLPSGSATVVYTDPYFGIQFTHCV